MKKFKLLSIAAVLALVGVGAEAASYTATNPIQLGSSYTFNSGKVLAGSGSFNDSYTYTLGNGVTGVDFLFNIALPEFPFSPLSFALVYQGGTFTALSGGNVFNTYSSVDEDGELVSFTTLDKTEYRFGLRTLTSGEKTITLGGSFQEPFAADKGYSLTVSAVPEPESYAMLMMGLGLLAAVARRNKKSI